MVFDKIFKRGEQPPAEAGEGAPPAEAPQPPKEQPDFVEVGESNLAGNQQINVRIENLEGFPDTDRVQNMIRNGSVVFLRIRNLRNRDISELKRSVEKLRKTCMAMDGDIVGVDEDFLIITPSFAHVYRGKS